MKAGSIQRFELNGFLLQYDCSGEMLLCRSLPGDRKLWIKKIDEGGIILDVVDSGELFLIAFEYDDTGGQFMAVNKSDGKTEWFIPGRAYMYRVFGGYVFLIFIDGNGDYHFIKSSISDGGMVWHHPVSMELTGYTIRNDYISLVFSDGRKETLDFETGELVR